RTRWADMRRMCPLSTRLLKKCKEDDVRVSSAFSRLVRLPGVWVKDVRFQPDRVVVEVALRRRRLQCPRCEFSTAARKDTRPVHTIWRHLDLGVWRLEI